MQLTPCDDWTSIAAIEADPRYCAPEGSGEPEDDLSEYVLRATEAMWVITGRRFGVCTTTVRPRRRGCVSGCSPVRCRCDDGILLHQPMESVDLVMIDGVEFLDYQVRNGRTIHRTDGESWPPNQDLNLPDTEVDTFSVTYTYGIAPPALVLRATRELAVQFWMLDNDIAGCSLPYGTKTITRQGMTIDIERALESSNRLVNDAANAYPMTSGMPSDAWFASDWELIIISA
jgi:hypothetical protein